MRLTSRLKSTEHHITVPRHESLRVGTLRPTPRAYASPRGTSAARHAFTAAELTRSKPTFDIVARPQWMIHTDTKTIRSRVLAFGCHRPVSASALTRNTCARKCLRNAGESWVHADVRSARAFQARDTRRSGRVAWRLMSRGRSVFQG